MNQLESQLRRSLTEGKFCPQCGTGAGCSHTGMAGETAKPVVAPASASHPDVDASDGEWDLSKHPDYASMKKQFKSHGYEEEDVGDREATFGPRGGFGGHAEGATHTPLHEFTSFHVEGSPDSKLSWRHEGHYMDKNHRDVEVHHAQGDHDPDGTGEEVSDYLHQIYEPCNRYSGCHKK